MRDDFAAAAKKVIANRAGNKCSNPTCGKVTSMPNPTEPSKAMSIGVAAHIEAASPGGPRRNESSSSQERSSVENGVWLCQTCSRAIDVAPEAFPEVTLRAWKEYAEQRASRESIVRSDKVEELMAQIDDLHTLINSYVLDWQQGEIRPSPDTWDADVKRMILYSEKRIAAYQKDIMPPVREILDFARIILGPVEIVATLEEASMIASVNYLAAYALAGKLQSLKNYLRFYS